MVKKKAVLTFGANSYGQLGKAECEQITTPVEAELDLEEADFEPLDVVGGGGHSFVLTDKGDLYGSGWNSRGQLGAGHRTNYGKFTKIPLPLFGKGVKKVACGWDFTLLITRDKGQLLVSGSNNFGQLGLGDECKGVDGFVPVNSVQPGPFRDVSAGLRHSLLVHEDGSVLGTGSNKRGQLGLPLKKDIMDWTKIDELKNRKIKSVFAGQHFSLALDQDGKSLFGFGDNRWGQMFTERDIDDSNVAREIKVKSGNKSIKKVTCGWTHTAVLFEDGSAESCGRSDYGQLGCGFEEGQCLDLESGSEHCLALKSDGKLVSWGWNEHGSCGNGNTKNVKGQSHVLMPDDVKIGKFFAASGHNLVIVERIQD